MFTYQPFHAIALNSKFNVLFGNNQTEALPFGGGCDRQHQCKAIGCSQGVVIEDVLEIVLIEELVSTREGLSLRSHRQSVLPQIAMIRQTVFDGLWLDAEQLHVDRL